MIRRKIAEVEVELILNDKGYRKQIDRLHGGSAQDMLIAKWLRKEQKGREKWLQDWAKAIDARHTQVEKMLYKDLKATAKYEERKKQIAKKAADNLQAHIERLERKAAVDDEKGNQRKAARIKKAADKAKKEADDLQRHIERLERKAAVADVRGEQRKAARLKREADKAKKAADDLQARLDKIARDDAKRTANYEAKKRKAAQDAFAKQIADRQKAIEKLEVWAEKNDVRLANRAAARAARQAARMAAIARQTAMNQARAMGVGMVNDARASASGPGMASRLWDRAQGTPAAWRQFLFRSMSASDMTAARHDAMNRKRVASAQLSATNLLMAANLRGASSAAEVNAIKAKYAPAIQKYKDAIRDANDDILAHTRSVWKQIGAVAYQASKFMARNLWSAGRTGFSMFLTTARRTFGQIRNELGAAMHIATTPFRVAGRMLRSPLGLLGMVGAGYSLHEGVSTMMELENATADFARVLGTTTNRAKSFVNGLRGMAGILPGVGLHEYISTGMIGAKAGIENPLALRSFVADMTKFGAVLGSESGMFEEFTERIISLITVFGRGTQDAGKFASAVLALDAASVASARDILDVANRMAPGAAMFNMSPAHTLALATALRQAKVPVETAGTSMGQIFMRMASSRDMGGFARLAGMKRSEFSEQLAGGGLFGLLGRIGTNLSGMDPVSASRELDRLHLDGQRVRLTLVGLARTYNQLTNYVEIGNKEWGNATFLMEGFKRRSETTSAQITLAKNNFAILAAELGRFALPAIKGVAEGLVTITQSLQAIANANWKGLTNLGESTRNMFAGLGLLIEKPAAIGDWVWNEFKLKGLQAVHVLTNAFTDMWAFFSDLASQSWKRAKFEIGGLMFELFNGTPFSSLANNGLAIQKSLAVGAEPTGRMITRRVLESGIGPGKGSPPKNILEWMQQAVTPNGRFREWTEPEMKMKGPSVVPNFGLFSDPRRNMDKNPAIQEQQGKTEVSRVVRDFMIGNQREGSKNRVWLMNLTQAITGLAMKIGFIPGGAVDPGMAADFDPATGEPMAGMGGGGGFGGVRAGGAHMSARVGGWRARRRAASKAARSGVWRKTGVLPDDVTDAIGKIANATQAIVMGGGRKPLGPNFGSGLVDILNTGKTVAGNLFPGIAKFSPLAASAQMFGNLGRAIPGFGGGSPNPFNPGSIAGMNWMRRASFNQGIRNNRDAFNRRMSARMPFSQFALARQSMLGMNFMPSGGIGGGMMAPPVPETRDPVNLLQQVRDILKMIAAKGLVGRFG